MPLSPAERLGPSFPWIDQDPIPFLRVREAVLRLQQNKKDLTAKDISTESGFGSTWLSNVLTRRDSHFSDVLEWVNAGMPLRTFMPPPAPPAAAPATPEAVSAAPVAPREPTVNPAVDTSEASPSESRVDRRKGPRPMPVNFTTPQKMPRSIQRALGKEKTKRKLLSLASQVWRNFNQTGVLSLPATSVEAGKHFTDINSQIGKLGITAEEFKTFVASIHDPSPRQMTSSQLHVPSHPHVSPAESAKPSSDPTLIPRLVRTEDHRRLVLLKRIRGDDQSSEQELENLRAGNMDAFEQLMGLIETNHIQYIRTVSSFLTLYRRIDDLSYEQKDKLRLHQRFNGGKKTVQDLKKAHLVLSLLFKDVIASSHYRPFRLDTQSPAAPALAAEPTSTHSVTPAPAAESAAPEPAYRQIIRSPRIQEPEDMPHVFERMIQLKRIAEGFTEKGQAALAARNYEGARTHYEAALRNLYSVDIGERLTRVATWARGKEGEETLAQQAALQAAQTAQLTVSIERMLALLDACDALSQERLPGLLLSAIEKIIDRARDSGQVTTKDAEMLHKIRQGTQLPYSGIDATRRINRRILAIDSQLTIQIASRNELHRIVTSDTFFQHNLDMDPAMLKKIIQDLKARPTDNNFDRDRILPLVILIAVKTDPELHAMFMKFFPQLEGQIALVRPEEEDQTTSETPVETYQRLLGSMGLDPNRKDFYTDDELNHAFKGGTGAARYSILHQLINTPESVRRKAHGLLAAAPTSPAAAEAPSSIKNPVQENKAPAAAVPNAPTTPAQTAASSVEKESEGKTGSSLEQKFKATVNILEAAQKQFEKGQQQFNQGEFEAAAISYTEAMDTAKVVLDGGKLKTSPDPVIGFYELFDGADAANNTTLVNETSDQVSHTEKLIKDLRVALQELQKAVQASKSTGNGPLVDLINNAIQKQSLGRNLRIANLKDLAGFVQSQMFAKLIGRDPRQLLNQIRNPGPSTGQGRDALQHDKDVLLTRIVAYLVLTDAKVHAALIDQFPEFKSQITIQKAQEANIVFKDEKEKALYDQYLDDVKVFEKFGFKSKVNRGVTPHDYHVFYKSQNNRNPELVAAHRRLATNPIYPEKFRNPEKFVNKLDKKFTFIAPFLPVLVTFFYGQTVGALVAGLMGVGFVSWSTYHLAHYVRSILPRRGLLPIIKFSEERVSQAA
jgi:hypothetical protein